MTPSIPVDPFAMSSLPIVSLPRPASLVARLRARLRSGDLEVEVVQSILDHFGLKLAKPVRNLPVGRRNTNVEVETTGGRKLLKGYRPQWPAETVRYAHSILHELAEDGFPAPRLTVAVDGSDSVSHTIGRNNVQFALFDFEEGKNYSGRFLLRNHRQQLMAVAGHTLAHFHRRLNGFLPEGRHHMGFADYTGDRHRDIDWHINKVDELAQKSAQVKGPDESAIARWLVQHSSYILGELTRMDKTLAAADLPRLIIHGDYGLHNLLFAKDGRVIPVDYELARLEWRLSDLVSCLSRFRYDKAGEIAYDLESIGWFMEAYQLQFPLSKDEWEFFPQVWAFYRLQSAVQYWNSYFETNGPLRKLFSARDAIDQVAWALRNPATLMSLNIGV